MSTKQSGKIIRIGIIQRGRIIEERFIRKRQTVTIGESPKASFIIPVSDAAVPKLFPLFIDKGSRYELSFTSDMSGKVTSAGSVGSLKEMVSSGKAKKKGNAYLLPLSDDMKGKVTFGEVTVIFHFVQAPPLPAKPKLPASIRGGWVKSIDWVYVAILFASFVAHSTFFGYASTQPIPKRAKLEMVAERFAKIIATDLPKLKEDTQELEGEGEGLKEEKKPEKKAKKDENEGSNKPKKEMSDRERAEAAAKRRAEIAKKVAGAGLIALLTSKGPASDGSGTALADTLQEGGRFGEIDSMMEGVTGVGVAKKATERGRRGGGGGPESKEIGRAEVSSGGKEGLSGRAEKKIVAKASLGVPTVDGSLDQKAVNRIVKRNQPAIKHCYEAELRLNPKLNGKVTVEWTIGSTGAVTNASVVSSSLSNSNVEKCILKTVRRWRFPRPEDETVIEYPFIFMSSR